MKAPILVIGLGRFGVAAAQELMALDHEVMAIDVDEARVDAMAHEVTSAFALDATDEGALRSVGAAEFDQALVAIGEQREASIFATMILKRLGVRSVVAKASSPIHGEILGRIGADRVVYAEAEMGARTSHTLRIPGVIDYLDVAPAVGLAKVRAPAAFDGRTLRDLGLAGGSALVVVAARHGDEVRVQPEPDHVVRLDDELTVIGPDEQLDRLGG